MNQVRFDAELIARHGGRGPRYTSYPTAPQFTRDFASEDYWRHAVASNGAGAAPLSLYLHLPFCESLCYYCGCNKVVTRNAQRAQDYLDTLQREAAMHSRLYDDARRVEQLHLGGGTPTYYSDAQLSRLMGTLREQFTFASADALQCSIEVDPRTVGPDRIAALAALGFNRLSLGVQDFDPQVQRAINRPQSQANTIALIEAARTLGYRSVSVDLIYGLPQQTPSRFALTLEAVIDARPDRVSLYSYAHLPHLFKSQALINAADLPSDPDKLSLLELSIARLCGAGYEYIGMDHFALGEDELVQARDQGQLHRNFQGYSTHAHCDLISLGASAIGNVGASFYQNEKNTNAYCAAVNAGQWPIVRGMALSSDDTLRAQIIQALMCDGRLDIRAIERAHALNFREYFADDLTALSDLRHDGLVDIDDAEIRVTRSGQLLLRPIAMCFDRYLHEAAAPAQGFSKVI